MSSLQVAAAGTFVILLTTRALGAQSIQLTAGGAAVTNSEITEDRQARGLGFTGGIGVTAGRFRVEAHGLTASLKADFSSQPDYAVHQVDVTATYLWRPLLGLQVGAARRFVSPEYAAQETGLLHIGLVSEMSLTSLAAVQGRFAYLPVTEFSGGGGGGTSVELGLGLRLGRTDAPWGAIVGFSYQRLGREVNGVSAPAAFSVAQVKVGRRM